MTARIAPADVAAVVARLTEFGAHVEAATVTALATDLDAWRLLGPQRDWWSEIAASVGRSCVTLPDVAVAVREVVARKDAEIARLRAGASTVGALLATAPIGTIEGWRRSPKSGGHYNIYAASHDPDAAIVALREWFDSDDSVNEMNLIFFSTSGVHGSYTTIEEIEASMVKYPDGPPLNNEGGEEWPDDYCQNEITFLIVQPRLVGMTYGNATIRNADDVAWVKRVRDLSRKAVAKIGGGR